MNDNWLMGNKFLFASFRNRMAGQFLNWHIWRDSNFRGKFCAAFVEWNLTINQVCGELRSLWEFKYRIIFNQSPIAADGEFHFKWIVDNFQSNLIGHNFCLSFFMGILFLTALNKFSILHRTLLFFFFVLFLMGNPSSYLLSSSYHQQFYLWRNIFFLF